VRALTRHIAVAVVLLSWSICARAERLPLKIYTTAEGLPHNEIHRIVRDSRGLLWFCTRDGLARFDGYSFTTYGLEQGLPSADVADLLETRDGRYWVATAAGLVRFDPSGAPRPRVTATSHSAAEPPPMFTVVLPAAGDPAPSD
jgi:ligand-binding sensor domain-containing protein